jgi:hypothetical protein
LGLTLSFKHLAKQGMVELQAEAAIDAAIRRACWACYWSPDDVCCAWRLTRNRCRKSNTFPTSGPVEFSKHKTSENYVPTATDDKEELDTAKMSLENEQDNHTIENLADLEGAGESAGIQKQSVDDDVLHVKHRSALEIHSGSKSSSIHGIGHHFILRDSYTSKQAKQPLSFVRPLTLAQLHTLGWMTHREAHDCTYLSTQILRERLAETDLCLEVRVEREFQTSRGGILADALGYGKTACMIALIAETRQQSLQELLNLGQWPQIAGQRVLTDATLIVTPPNLFDQWLREIQKFVVSSSGLRVLAVPGHTRLKTFTVADFVAADVVLVPFRFFFSEAYQRYFDEITKPGLKVWDEVSVQRREAFCKKRKADNGKQNIREKTAAPCGVKREGETDMYPTPATNTYTLNGIAESLSVDIDDAPAKDSGRQQQATPALQLSKYYLEMRTGKDYLPQRYLDLERRTRRLLKGAETAEELAQSPALFEMFYFKRVVFDEFHEVVQVSSQQAMAASSIARAPFYALHALQGRCHWGLTATPLLSSAAAVAQMASLLRVFVPHDDEEEAQRFLDTWVTSNTWDDSSIPLQEHWVEVELTAMEHVLYLHQLNVLSEQGSRGPENAHARTAERRLLQLCTHFDPECTSGQPAPNACAALSQQVQRLRSILEQAVCRQRLCDEQREELLSRSEICGRLTAALPDHAREANLACTHCELSELNGLAEAALQASDARLNSELALVEADLRRLAQAAVDGQPPALAQHVDEGCEPCRHLRLCEERVKHFNRSKGHSLGEQRHAEAQLRFLEAVSKSLEVSTLDHVECPACFHDASAGATTILPCGHRLHLSCATEAISAQGCCPQCQRPASLQTCTNVAELLQHAGAGACKDAPSAVTETEEAERSTTSLRSQYGSKLCKVIETIQDIQKVEGEATKCLVFIQWDIIALQLECAMRAVGMTPLVLRGHLSQRQKSIATFVEGRSLEASIMLLSLESSPTGMNLACAHHVLLVHPMHADRCEEAALYEMQAIGRVRRRGQNHTVHIHRFFARGTVEEALARRHSELCQQPRHGGTV